MLYLAIISEIIVVEADPIFRIKMEYTELDVAYVRGISTKI
jgi:hypothetical protein